MKYINTYYQYNFTDKNELSIVDTIHLNYQITDYYKLPERISSISDKKTGQLLLYSNNWNLLDGNHKEIKNGDLKNASEVYYYHNKGYRFTENLIIPSSKDDICAVFYLAEKNNKKGLFYNLVNLKSNNNSPEVYYRDNFLVDELETFTAAYHENLKNKWVIVYKYFTNELIAFNLDENFNVVNKTVLSLKNIIKKSDSDTQFKLVVSPKANKIALTYYQEPTYLNPGKKISKVYMFYFNNNNGDINYLNSYTTPAEFIHSISFSKNGIYLYGLYYQRPEYGQTNTKYSNYKLFRLNVRNFKFETKQLKIFHYKIGSDFDGIYSPDYSHNLEIGLDNNFYMLGRLNQYLETITNNLTQIYNVEHPIDYVEEKLILNNIQHFSLPHSFPMYSPEIGLSIFTNAPVCMDQNTLKIYALFSHPEVPDVTYEWIAPNGLTYNKDSIYIKNPTKQHVGKYYLHVKSKSLNVDLIDSVEITLYDPPQFNLIKIGDECGNLGITLKTDINFLKYFRFYWNNGDTAPVINVKESGKYTLTVTDTNGCETSKSIDIKLGKKPSAEITAKGATTFCEGGKVELVASGGMNNNELRYLWSTGEIFPNIFVTKSGTYKVIITHNISSCTDTAEIEIKVNPKLESSIIQVGSLCKGNTLELKAEPQGPDYKYLWSNGATTSSIMVSQAGKYSVEVSLDEICKSSAEIEIKENQAPDFEILTEGKLCVGEIVKLTPNKDFSEYKWSNGDTTKEISVSSNGKYSLTITDGNGCSNEKSIDVKFISPREYKLDFTDYNFGNIVIGEVKRIKINLPNDPKLQVNFNGDFTYDLQTNEMVFKPTAEGDYTGSLVLDYGGECDTTATINFRGKGIVLEYYFAKVIAPKVTTEIGLDKVELPINFEINDDKMIYPFDLDYKIKISLNYEIFNTSLPSIINANKREIEVAGKTTINKGFNTLTTIIGKTYLSSDFENEIKILNFEHKTDRLNVEKEDGYLNISGICLQNLRGVTLFTPTKMKVSPNPVSSDLTININTEEKGQHKLRLIDITGNSREIGDFTITELTEKVIKINSKDLAKGQYLIELITPNQTVTEKVVVE